MSGPETHSVKRHLDVDADGYDVQIRRLIPHYDEMIATGVQLVTALASPTRACWTSVAVPVHSRMPCSMRFPVSA